MSVWVVPNSTTDYRVRVGWQASYPALRLDVPVLGVLDSSALGPAAAQYTYTDITANVTGIDIRRGRSRTTDRMTAGTCSVTVYDPQRTLDPENTAGPNYGNLKPGRPLIVDIKPPSSAWITVYAGWTTGIGWQQIPNGYQVAQIDCADNLSTLALAALDTDLAVSAEYSGQRFTNVLSAVAYPGTSTASTGSANVVAGTVAKGTSALDYLTSLAGYEWGHFFDSRAGVLTWRGRTDSLNPVATPMFTPDSTGTQYSSVNAVTGTEVYNVVSVTDNAGAEQIVTDVASTVYYGMSALAITGGLQTASDSAVTATFILDQYKTPATNVREVVVDIDSTIQHTKQEAMFSLDLGDAVRVDRHFATGTPSTLTEYYAVEGIAHTITRTGHQATFTFGAKTTGGYLTLDSSALGQLDSNLLAPG